MAHISKFDKKITNSHYTLYFFNKLCYNMRWSLESYAFWGLFFGNNKKFLYTEENL